MAQNYKLVQFSNLFHQDNLRLFGPSGSCLKCHRNKTQPVNPLQPAMEEVQRLLNFVDNGVGA